MKLIKAHIDDFGTIHDKDFDLSSDLVNIKGDNGTGKSTLASFIKVMFYGFENDSKRDELAKERILFHPWNGDSYGGSLVYEKDGKEYRIDASFGDTASKDRYTLYDNKTGLSIDDNSSDAALSKKAKTGSKKTKTVDRGAFGSSLFGVDCPAFKNTIFIGQDDLRPDYGAVSGITAKIGRVDESADMKNFTSAVNILKDKINSLKPDDKRGSLSKLEDRIGELELEVSDLPVKEKLLDEKIYGPGGRKELLSDREALEKEIGDINAKLDISLEYDKAQKVILQYENLKKAKAGSEAEFRSIKSYFVNGLIPTDSYMTEALETANKMVTWSGIQDSNELSDQEKEDYNRLSDIFKDRVPEKEEISDIRKKWKDIQDIREQISKKQAELSDIKHGKELRKAEAERRAAEEKSRHVNEMIDRKIAAENRKRKEEERLRETEAAVKKYKHMFIIGIILTVTIVLCPVGIPLIIISQKRLKALKQEEAELQVNIADASYDTPDDQAELQSFDGAEAAYDDAESDKQISNVLLEIDSLTNEVRKGSAHIRSFLKEYSYDAGSIIDKAEGEAGIAGRAEDAGDIIDRSGSAGYDNVQGSAYGHEDHSWIPDAVDKLASDVVYYKNLEEKNKNLYDACEKYEKGSAILSGFEEKYGLELSGSPQEALNKIQVQIGEYKKRETDLKAAADDLNNFFIEHQHEIDSINDLIENRPKETTAELNKLKDDKNSGLQRINECIIEKENEIDAVRRNIDELNGLKASLKELEEKRAYESHLYAIVQIAKSYLEKAKDEFSSNYMQPLKESFDKYYQMFTGEAHNDYTIDANFEVKLRVNSDQKKTGYLSEGYQDMVGLCLRMAWVDAMFTGEKPFIIMDDPFVNLDDDKLKGAKEFIKKIAEDYHVIYFTCHLSREIV